MGSSVQSTEQTRYDINMNIRVKVFIIRVQQMATKLMKLVDFEVANLKRELEKRERESWN